MANAKQDGSNLKNTEFYTGRCPSQCEQCFVNFGQQGSTVIKNIQHPSQVKWRAYARECGWKGGNWAIPKSPESIATHQQKVITVGEQQLPVFLRVSSMSDSSLSPAWWINDVRDAWGDHCFFNSAIKSINAHPENMALYHKLVVTMNPGKQAIPKAFGTGQCTPKSFLGSMGKRGPMDFMSPTTLSNLGLGDFEGAIKFYRLRAISTIWPYLTVGSEKVPAHVMSADIPIVVTQMRFKSLANICEFARKYGLHIEVGCQKGSANQKVLKAFKLESAWYLSPYLIVRLWTDKKSVDNASPYAGEAAVFHYSGSFLRPTEFQDDSWPEFPFVCDRAYGGCGACGLCATLDGTQEGWDNALNPYRPVPYARGYVGSQIEAETDYFARIMQNVVGFEQNPRAELPEKSLSWIEDSLKKVVGYLLQGSDDGEYHCEGWNTHEDVATLTAYCMWCLIRKAKQGGMSQAAGIESIMDFVMQVTDGYDVLGGMDEIWEMWTDSSSWNDQFGSTEA